MGLIHIIVALVVMEREESKRGFMLIKSNLSHIIDNEK